MIQKVHKTNPYELSGLVQKETRLLYDEQIKFRLFFHININIHQLLW